jgi:ATP-binding cassette subfamily F protein 3
MILTLSDISKSFGKRVLLREVNMRVLAGDRIALIGPNGAGKTTLMEIITGDTNADSGQVFFGKDVRIGYLEQEAMEMEHASVLQEVMGAAANVQDLEKRIRMLEAQMAETENDSDEQHSLMAEYSHAVTRFETQGGWDIEHQAKAMLGGFGCSTSDLDKDVSEFSGGWQMRIALAKLLLRQPDLLLLDEPVAGMSPREREQTGELLQRISEGRSVVVIEHDMDFVKRIAHKVTVLHQGKLLAEGTAQQVQQDPRVIDVYLGH